MTRRILTIIVAIVLAVIGTTAVLIYVRQADQRALAGQRAVTVLVATQQIPAGTTARTAMTNGWLAGQKYPASSVPPGALSSITPGVAGLVFTSNLAAGQLLTRPILGAAVASSSSLPIPPGMVAVTVEMCVQKAVAGFIQAGSHIAVFNTFFHGQSVTASCSSITWQKQTNIHTRLVLNNVEVVAVGNAAPSGGAGATSTAFSQNNNNNSTSGQTTVLITVAVNQADAERVIDLVMGPNLPYMALLGNSSGTHPDASINP